MCGNELFIFAAKTCGYLILQFFVCTKLFILEVLILLKFSLIEYDKLR